MRGGEAHVLEVASGLSTNKARGALLFPLRVGAANRADGLVAKIDAFLPSMMAARSTRLMRSVRSLVTSSMRSEM